MVKLQFHLLQDLVAYQKVVDAYQEKKREVEQRKKPKEQDLQYIDRQILLNSIMIQSLRTIADGMAWRLLHYDRPLLYILGDRPERGPLRPHIGLLSEVTEWALVHDYGDGSAILNDLTSVLRIGDITILGEDGSVEFREVKSSANARGKQRRARLERQARTGEEIVRFFNTDEGELANREVKIVNATVSPKYSFDLVGDAIRAAGITGVSHAVIEDNLVLECADHAAVKDGNSVIAYFEQNTAPIVDQWQRQGDKVVPFWSADRIDFSKSIAPYSIFPFDETVCAGLMTGRLTLHMYLNLSSIFRRIAATGWQIERTLFDIKPDERNQASTESFIRIRRGPFYLEAPPTLFGRMAFEYLSLNTLLEEFEWEHQNAPKYRTQYVLTRHPSEATLWK